MSTNITPRKKATHLDRRSLHDFFVDPLTGDIHDAYYDHPVVLKNADRHEDSPPLVHPKSGQIFHPWTGEILNLTPEQAITLQEEEEYHQRFHQQLADRQKKRVKGDYDDRVSQHAYFIHPLTGDVYDAYEQSIASKDENRQPDSPPLIHPSTGQQYDPWTGQALNLTPSQISQLKFEEDYRKTSSARRMPGGSGPITTDAADGDDE